VNKEKERYTEEPKKTEKNKDKDKGGEAKDGVKIRGKRSKR
jgi:hypothetical protein